MNTYPYSVSRSLGVLTLLGASLFAACAGESNRPPGLFSLQDHQLNINQNFQLEITAFDQDNDLIEFDFQLTPPPPTPTSTSGGVPTLQKVSDYRAIFNWTPGNADVGQYNLTIIVRDPDQAASRETISLTVTEGGGSSGGWLRFIEPVGEASILNLSETPCLELAVRVQSDALSDHEINLSLAPPSPLTASLHSDGPKSYRLSWCPTPEDVSTQTNFPFIIRATTTRGLPPIDKRYLVRVRSQGSTDCPGTSPTISHMPVFDYVGVENIRLSVFVEDDIGIKSAPTVSYQFAPVSSQTPVENAWDTVIMTADSSGRSGQWLGEILPPLTPEGVIVFYRFQVSDDDDPNGALCDHYVESQLYRFSYRWDTSLSTGGASACVPCIDDIQCGGPDDRCLLDESGVGVCGQACDLITINCPASYHCEPSPLNVNMPSQCVSDNACGGVCPRDVYEAASPGESSNDQETGATPLQVGTYAHLSICSGDQDHYSIQVDAGQTLTARIEFASRLGDLDLELRDRNNPASFPTRRSTSSNNDFEEVSLRCSEGGVTAIIDVYGFEGAQNEYTLTLELADLPCEDECFPDLYEGTFGNDTIFEATLADFNTPYNGQICPQDLDHYRVYLNEGTRVEARLELDSTEGDLALDLLNSSGQILQSADGLGRNVEIIEFTASQAGEYYFVVLSPQANANTPYQLTIRGGDSLCSSTTQCPAGQYCSGDGECIPNQCSGSCESGHYCVSQLAGRVPSNQSGLCASACAMDYDCREGEGCKSFESSLKGCAPAGTQGLAQTCSSFSECSGEMICLPAPGGYCAEAGCFTQSQCPPNTLCGTLEGQLACLKTCQIDSDCGRVDLSCREIAGGRACVP